MAAFHALPGEIVLLIAEACEPSANNALVRTHRRFHDLVKPVLYRHDADHNNSSSVFWAARNGFLQTLRYAVSLGGEINLFGPDPRDRRAALKSILDEDAFYDAEEDNRVYGTPLHLAAMNGHDTIVAWLLRHGASIDAPSKGLCSCAYQVDWNRQINKPTPRWLALHLAICHRHHTTVELIIDYLQAEDGPRAESMTPHAVSWYRTPQPGFGVTVFQSAAASGDLGILESMFNKCPQIFGVSDLEKPDFDDNTMLHYLSQSWDREFLRSAIRLVHAKLPGLVHRVNRNGHTPLLNACFIGNFALAISLLELTDAGVNAVDDYSWTGYTALHFACRPLVEINQVDFKKVSREEWDRTRLALISELVARGANVEATTRFQHYQGCTPLQLASAAGLTEAVRTLINTKSRAEEGDDGQARISERTRYLEIRDSHGRTALMYAALGRSVQTVENLIAAGADLEAKDSMEKTALHYALVIETEDGTESPGPVPIFIKHCVKNRSSAVSILLWALSQAETTNSWPLDALLDNSTPENIGADDLFGPLITSCREDSQPYFDKLVRYAMRHDFELHEVTKCLLSAAFKNDDAGELRCVLSLKLPVGWVLQDGVVTPEALLALALAMKKVDIAKFLLQSLKICADGTIQEMRQKPTLLHLAAKIGDADIVRLILKCNPPLDIFDISYNTPILTALTWGFPDVAAMLLEAGADPHLKMMRREQAICPLKNVALDVGSTPAKFVRDGFRKLDLDSQYECDRAPHHSFASSAYELAIKQGHERLVKAMIEKFPTEGGALR